ncbi:hypothetical protein ACHAQH_009964 [Verticillium albo-atrum]
MHRKAPLVVLAIALVPFAHTLEAIILADSNRDGKIDIATDAEGKTTWSDAVGALFMPNIGDSEQRCSRQVRNLRQGFDSYEDEDGSKLAAINALLDSCNDASDNIQRNAKYLAPLQVLPNPELSDSATGSIYVSSCVAAKKVRIFYKEGANWTYVAANHTFTADELKAGLELGIDSRDIRRPSWDGKATVHLVVSDGDDTATDSVALRVVPVLTHHHAQAATKVFTVSAMYNNSQVQFVSDFVDNIADAGIEEPVYLFSGDDQWAQDFFEPGYAVMPGPHGRVMLRILIRSAQSYREAGWEVFDHLRSDTVGAAQMLADGTTIDSLGNLETIPPYTHNGTTFPAGRIIMGEWDGVKPFIFDLLEAQELQAPLALDTAWLSVGHVDEFLQFLPAETPRGWVMMVDDPLYALEILRNAAASNHGDERAVSRPLLPGEDPSFTCLPKQSISQVLQLENFAEINAKAAERIHRNIEILKRETGITEAEIFRVPSLFYYVDLDPFACGNSSSPSQGTNLTTRASRPEGGPYSKAVSILEAATPPSHKGLARRQTSFGPGVVALYPGTINSVVVADSMVLAPNPWGPVINGTDILAEAVSAVYAKAGFNVTYQDDWFSHHLLSGEIHCGSNVWREVDGDWWQSLEC